MARYQAKWAQMAAFAGSFPKAAFLETPICSHCEAKLSWAMLPDFLRSLPYVVHTNRELGLMLSGEKPLASFVDGKDCFPEVVERYLRLFDRHVEEGRIVRRDHFSEAIGRRSYIAHRILFALPGQEWRMQAMIDLMTGDEPWSPELERRQGELLGYADWMNDYWLEFAFGKQTV